MLGFISVLFWILLSVSMIALVAIVVCGAIAILVSMWRNIFLVKEGGQK